MAGRRSGRNSVTVAVAVSITVHIALLAVFLMRRETPAAEDPPIFSVEIVSPASLDAGRTHRFRVASAERPSVPTAASRPDILSSPARADAAPPSVPPSIDGSQADARDAVLRGALRGRVGCDRATLFSLTAEERRRCDERRDAAMAQMDGDPAQVFDLSKGSRFHARDETPYLARKPKNGCKVMTGGRTYPRCKEVSMAGIGCAVSF